MRVFRGCVRKIIPSNTISSFIKFQQFPVLLCETAMAFGATEAIASISPSYPSIPPKSSSISQYLLQLGSTFPFLKFAVSTLPLLSSSRNPGFQLHSAVESVTAEEQVEESKKSDSRRKLFVLNLPWSYSVTDIKKLFGECGTVEDVEIIKHEGFTFVTMASGEEARAAIEKYDTYELDGRIVRVEFSRRFKETYSYSY